MVHPDLKDHLDALANRVPRDLLDQRDLSGSTERRGSLDWWDLWVLQGLLVFKGIVV